MRAILTIVAFVIGLAAPNYRERPADPFGIDTIDVQHGPLVEIWRTVSGQILRDSVTANTCVENESDCAPALELLKIVAEAQLYQGKSLVGHLNRSINLLLRPAPGAWISALDTVKLGSGDCKGYSIAKYFALRQAGIPPDYVRLVIVHHEQRHEDHMVAAVYEDGHWLILDNLTMFLLQDPEEHYYTPLFVLDDDGVRRYISSIGVG